MKTRPAKPGELAAPLEEPEIPSLGLSALAFGEVQSRLHLAQMVVLRETDSIRLPDFLAPHVEWEELRPWAVRYIRWERWRSHQPPRL
ncbi:MAG: hypothetical protein D6682_02395 [Zetaproteobacteria bacterium]|nr:MAG: hypothetical protein D6682_02395 [Zetaproteobacteria bacterium]